MAKRPSVLIVEARYYAHVADALLKGAEAALDNAGVRYDCVTVPGAFEIPAAIALAARTRKYDGYVALGCVIRGETTHYDLVCQECARGIQDLALTGHAIGFGVLTVENVDQAFARARIDEKNKGGEAVRACLAMIALHQSFKARR
ncbi:MAG: 6,7-dimethyl-8-ribityllumazine synthase [Alphaproteobacteria bacterium]|jgi:6,7-dimethyl-8-ribityllumazine synthase|nr:6,7-dimethyl-8-ribityllumazine synthase [Alphaproteobacteria bacterium]MDE1967692.1 6,7-dimethyl-8-ribityllumazine synthase [Alphaproteobacteria bacterium]MDE2514255.1 6,7-dimethyl-8-ribityllumazine synthase [Alphaproteobacteria bacterium]